MTLAYNAPLKPSKFASKNLTEFMPGLYDICFRCVKTGGGGGGAAFVRITCMRENFFPTEWLTRTFDCTTCSSSQTESWLKSHHAIKLRLLSGADNGSRHRYCCKYLHRNRNLYVVSSVYFVLKDMQNCVVLTISEHRFCLLLTFTAWPCLSLSFPCKKNIITFSCTIDPCYSLNFNLCKKKNEAYCREF